MAERNGGTGLTWANLRDPGNGMGTVLIIWCAVLSADRSTAVMSSYHLGFWGLGLAYNVSGLLDVRWLTVHIITFVNGRSGSGAQEFLTKPPQPHLKLHINCSS